jgi:hypothetical protein
VQIETALKNLKKPERLQEFLQKSDHLKELAPYATPVASPKRMDSEEAAHQQWQRLQVCIQVAITAAQKNLTLASGVASGELYTAAAAAPNLKRAALTAARNNLKQVYGLNPVVDSDVDTMMDPHFPQNDVVDGDLARRIHSSWS